MELNDVRRVALVGDLTMIGVTLQLPLLAEYIAEPVDGASLSLTDKNLREIDLTRIEALDACGCQMLVAFVRNLKRRGAVVPALKLTEEFQEIIRTLGFEVELLGGERP